MHYEYKVIKSEEQWYTDKDYSDYDELETPLMTKEKAFEFFNEAVKRVKVEKKSEIAHLKKTFEDDEDGLEIIDNEVLFSIKTDRYHLKVEIIEVECDEHNKSKRKLTW